MSSRAIFAVLVVAACVGGCTTEGSTPATAPDSTAPATTQPAPSDPVTSTTTIAPATTTTLDRLAEVTAIFEDLERRRLEAIYTGDVEAFTALFADTPYLDESLRVFDVIEPGPIPAISIEVREILKDDPGCLAVFYESFREDGSSVGPATAVLVPTVEGPRYAFTNSGRGGWLCDGPHPLSG